jgi:hypothetical protein
MSQERGDVADGCIAAGSQRYRRSTVPLGCRGVAGAASMLSSRRPKPKSEFEAMEGEADSQELNK